MSRTLLLAFLSGSLITGLLAPGTTPAQEESINSEHIRMLMPAERGSLGRELIADLERCYGFMDKATGSQLPRRILMTVIWDQPNSSCNWRNGSITLGMNQPIAAENPKSFLFSIAVREIARLGLLELSNGAQREDTEFLFEGMVEILAREYDHSSRSLEAAWVFSRFLDEMKMLGLATQRSWSKFSSGKPCLRDASPGITFISTFRELQGRDRPLKLFEALKKHSLMESLGLAFRAPPAELEKTWLQRVREHKIPDEITTAANEAPQLLQTTFVPDAGIPGGTLQLRLSIEDRARNLLPSGVFVRDERTGRVLQVQEASESGVGFMVAAISIDGNCPPGQYAYQVTAIDESGNLRRWSGTYKVAG